MLDRRERPAEFDVFLSSADGPETEVRATIAAYLARAGFRVFAPADAGGTADGEAATWIEQAPDFILLLGQATRTALADASSRVYGEVSRALSARRNIVCVEEAGSPSGRDGGIAGPPGLAAERRVAYDPDRLAESLAILAHSLSSEATVHERRDARRFRRWVALAVLCVLGGFSLQTVPMMIKAWRRPRPVPPVAPFTLYWAAFAERDANGETAEFALEPGVTVSAGDRIRVAFSPSADGFAYVIGKDTRGRVFVLFPTDVVGNASRVRAGRSYTAPVGADWLTVDAAAGLDTIYIFGSYDPLQNLEELVEEPETPASAAARRELVEQTIAGLLDGRHYQYGRRVWIRTTAFVDQSLQPPPGPATFTLARDGRPALTRAALAQRGLVSALAEITVRFAPAR
jgi:hypothetical protein